MHPIASIMTAAILTSLSACDSTAGSAQDQASVIGKPFRLSDSVVRYCATQPKIMMCEVFEPQLAEFLAEPRDAKWAAPIEALIAKSMLADGKPWVEIRALECRRARCALEYAVSVEDLAHDADGNAELDRLMEPMSGVVVPEPASGMGEGKMVSVLIWARHS
jgi:hypothetical protein